MIYRATNTAAMRTVATIIAHRQLKIAHAPLPSHRVPVQGPPKLAEAVYATKLIGLMDLRPALMPVIHETIAAVRAMRAEQSTRTDASPSRRMAELMDKARRRIDDAVSPMRIERLANASARDVLVHQHGQFAAQAKAAIGIDIHLHDRTVPGLVDHFMHTSATNVGALARKTTDDVAKRVAYAFTSGQREETIARDLEERLDIGDRHARFIARNDIGTLNSQVTAARHTELGISRFVWQSMEDDNVRPEHEELDGQEFDYDAPPSEGYPGEPMACRCMQQPVFANILNLLEGGESDAGGLAANDE